MHWARNQVAYRKSIRKTADVNKEQGARRKDAGKGVMSKMKKGAITMGEVAKF